MNFQTVYKMYYLERFRRRSDPPDTWRSLNLSDTMTIADYIADDWEIYQPEEKKKSTGFRCRVCGRYFDAYPGGDHGLNRAVHVCLYTDLEPIRPEEKKCDCNYCQEQRIDVHRLLADLRGFLRAWSNGNRLRWDKDSIEFIPSNEMFMTVEKLRKYVEDK